MDTLLIILLTSVIIGISAVLFRDKKNGGCASCPHNDSCSSVKSCPDPERSMKL